MLRTANPKRGIIPITTPESKAETIALDFKIIACKCVKTL